MPMTIDDNSKISISVEMTASQAYAYSQFLKRVAYRTYREYAVSQSDAYKMLYAGEAVRNALAEQHGFAPR